MNARIAEVSRLAARTYSRVERWSVVVLMVILVVFALYQILLRNFLSTGIVWGDNFLRHLVLWIGFLGACRATAEGRHIRVELSDLIHGARIGSMLSFIRILFLTAVCAALFHASWTFVANERSAGDLAFLNVPAWWLMTIFPLSFAVMTLRGLGQLWRSLRASGRAAQS